MVSLSVLFNKRVIPQERNSNVTNYMIDVVIFPPHNDCKTDITGSPDSLSFYERTHVSRTEPRANIMKHKVQINVVQLQLTVPISDVLVFDEDILRLMAFMF